jgi:acetolactate synthase-1/2/3 large subunit
MRGADVIADAFVRHRLDEIYVYPGGTIAPVLDLMDAIGIRIFCARHEQGAGYAAFAAARETGRPQVVMVTSGPGVTNLVTPIADAYFDSAPLVVLTGQVGTGDLRGQLPVRQRGFQEVDTVALLRPVTKAQFLPTTPDEVGDALEQAFAIAAEGRPGPVVVDLPMNVQRGELSKEGPSHRAVGAARRANGAPMLRPHDPSIRQAAEWLGAAERPVIIAGQGVLLAGAHEELRALADAGMIPVSQSLLALGAYPTAAPLALGFHGHTGNQTAGLAIQRADCLLVVGSRLDVRQTGSRTDAFAPEAKVIRVDLDEAELCHARVSAHLSIRADARAALRALHDALAERTPPPARRDWLDRIDRWKREHPLAFAREGRLAPQLVIETLNRLTAGEELVCVSGVGSHQQWTARHFDFDFPRRRWLTSGGHGAMGFDLPVAMGVQRRRPGLRVLCCVGDGSLQMNIQELATLVAYELPVKIAVLDNRRLGIVSQFQKLNWQRDPTCGDKWNPDFAAIARAYGLAAATVSSPGELEAGARWLLGQAGPALLHCHVDPEEDVSPMLLAGQTLDAMWARD